MVETPNIFSGANQVMDSMKALYRCTICLGVFAVALFQPASGQTFTIRQSDDNERIEVYEAGTNNPVITQISKAGMRPYLHPVTAPDGRGILTEIHPEHHLHQTGIYWGLKKVNGRDYFMNSDERYYKKISASILASTGDKVSWQTVYELLNEDGFGVLRETLRWTLKKDEGVFLLDLDWQGEGLDRVVVEQFYVGGLFVRMPWHLGISGEIVHAHGKWNGSTSEPIRANWADVGMAIEGRNDWGHVAILGHPDNIASPVPWRFDRQLGMGPSRQVLGDWRLVKGESTFEKYRLLIYTGQLDKAWLNAQWKSYALRD